MATQRTPASHSAPRRRSSSKPKSETRPDDQSDVKKVLEAAKTETPAPPLHTHHVPATLEPSAKRTAGVPPSRTRRIGMMVLLVVVILFAVSGAFSLGVYRFGLQGRWVDQVLRVLPLPAVTTNGTVITMHSYIGDLATLRYYFANNPAATADGSTKPDDQELKKIILNRLVYDTILRQAVDERKIVVSAADLDGQLKSIAQQSGKTDLTDVLQKLYGMTPDQFKQKILLPYLWFQKYDTAVGADESLNASVKTKAEQVLAEVKKGDAPFEDLAKSNSEDTTATSGGDLGFISKGQMVQPFEDAAFAMKVGEVSDLVKTEFGYHIIKVVEKKTDKDAGEQVHVKHILLKTKNADDLLQERMASARIHVFLKGYVWDPKNSWVATVAK